MEFCSLLDLYPEHPKSPGERKSASVGFCVCYASYYCLNYQNSWVFDAFFYFEVLGWPNASFSWVSNEGKIFFIIFFFLSPNSELGWASLQKNAEAFGNGDSGIKSLLMAIPRDGGVPTWLMLFIFPVPAPLSRDSLISSLLLWDSRPFPFTFTLIYKYTT